MLFRLFSMEMKFLQSYVEIVALFRSASENVCIGGGVTEPHV